MGMLIVINHYIVVENIESWDQSKVSLEKQRWGWWWRKTEPCQTGSDIEPVTQSDTMPREETGEEPRLDSESLCFSTMLMEKKNTFKV